MNDDFHDFHDVLYFFVWLTAITALIAIGVALYFAPTVIAKYRKKSNVGGILIINLVLGWAVIGWIVALVMACTAEPQRMEVRS